MIFYIWLCLVALAHVSWWIIVDMNTDDDHHKVI